MVPSNEATLVAQFDAGSEVTSGPEIGAPAEVEEISAAAVEEECVSAIDKGIDFYAAFP